MIAGKADLLCLPSREKKRYHRCQSHPKIVLCKVSRGRSGSWVGLHLKIWICVENCSEKIRKEGDRKVDVEPKIRQTQSCKVFLQNGQLLQNQSLLPVRQSLVGQSKVAVLSSGLQKLLVQKWVFAKLGLRVHVQAKSQSSGHLTKSGHRSVKACSVASLQSLKKVVETTVFHPQSGSIHRAKRK